jgi:hypothetical protein
MMTSLPMLTKTRYNSVLHLHMASQLQIVSTYVVSRQADESEAKQAPPVIQNDASQWPSLPAPSGSI